VCAISSSPYHTHSDNNESEYFSETLAAESLPHYQAPVKESPSPTSSPYSSPVETANHVNNNGQHFHQAQPVATQQSNTNMINNNQKYQAQPPTYNNNNMPTNGNGQPQLVRNNVVMSASIPAGGVSASSQMQQQLQQKYYDQYENYAKPNQSATPNSVNGNGMNNNHQNGMSQSAYNGTKAYASHPQQMTSSYNQQMAYNNHYNQNGPGIGKIADYDPLTDGPRNMPPASRPNQTLIYSSERTAQRESSDSISHFYFVCFYVLFAHQITFVMLVCKISC
jgi:LIM and SH3 domain protein 1